MWREFIKVHGINIWLDFHVSIQARVSLSVVNATNITSVKCHRNVSLCVLLKQSATIKSIFKAPNAILVNGEHVTVPVKIAKVLPLHKRDSIQERGNYRPISVLPILFKPLQRHIASAYLQYLTSNNLLYSNQSAYRPHHSRETALFNISDNWLKAIDNSELVNVGTVFLCLS